MPPSWPGKAVAQAREEAQYDNCLVVAAQILELPATRSSEKETFSDRLAL